MHFPSPKDLKQKLPLTRFEKIEGFRNTAKNILTHQDPRLALILGPCSIHDVDAAYEYALKLRRLTKEIEHTFFPIMRVFIEKPRTKHGWKGFVYDPFLDGSYAIEEGIKKSRELLLEITEMGIPCATEILDPMLVPYFEDLITWGLIGARTSASQPHRQIASGLPFAVGFKNDLLGAIDIAAAGVSAAKVPHAHVGINQEGKISQIQTKGNPLAHLVLRGSLTTPNFDRENVYLAKKILKNHGLEERLIIDCSHGNCKKQGDLQPQVFDAVFKQALEMPEIRGLMLESNLFSGNQAHTTGNLHYGVSITDSCLGWEETSALVRSKSISFVQK